MAREEWSTAPEATEAPAAPRRARTRLPLHLHVLGSADADAQLSEFLGHHFLEEELVKKLVKMGVHLTRLCRLAAPRPGWASISSRGSPATKLGVSRIWWPWRDPSASPSPEISARAAASSQEATF